MQSSHMTFWKFGIVWKQIFQNFLLGHIQHDIKLISLLLSDLDLFSFHLGNLQHLDELFIIHRVSLCGAE